MKTIWNCQVMGRQNPDLTSSSLNQASCVRTSLHFIKVLTKGIPGELPWTYNAIVKAIGCSPRTESKAYDWKEHLYNSMNIENSFWSCREPSILRSSIHAVAYTIKWKKRNTKPATNPVSNGPPYKIKWYNTVTKFVGVTSSYDWFKIHSMIHNS